MDILGLGLIQINDWLLLFIVIITALYYYYTWNFNYFTSRGIPGPKPIPLFGNTFEFFTKGPGAMMLDNAKKYGPIHGGFEGRRPVLNVRDPEFLKCLFVKNYQDFPNRRTFASDEMTDSMLSNAKGEQWKILRTVMSPTFSTGKLRVMTKQVNECAQELVDNINQVADTGKPIELKEYSGAYTMDVIAYTAFGLKIGSQKDRDNQFVKMAKKVFDFSLLNPVFICLFFFPFLIPVLKYFKYDFFPRDIKTFFLDATTKTIEARKESGEARTDFMQLLMDAHKEPNEEKPEDKEHDKEFKELYQGVTKRSLTKTEVLAQGMLFFIAGYETTALTIAFTLYELALNSDIQEKLHDEIMDIAGDQEITYNMLSEMNLLEMCCNETLRKYPPAMLTDRECSRDTNINGIDIPKGFLVSVPIYAIHHDPEIWPEPEKFNPYRFTPEEKAKHNTYDWMPFGAGPRNCIAMRLALTEVKMAVAYLVRKFKVVRCEKTEVPIQLKKVGFTSPQNGIWLEIEKR